MNTLDEQFIHQQKVRRCLWKLEIIFGIIGVGMIIGILFYLINCLGVI